MFGQVEVVGPQLMELAEALRAPMATSSEEASSSGGGVEGLAAALVAMAATAHALSVQSHLAHVNVEGPGFFELHDFLGEQYEKHLEHFDVLAELVRSLDLFVPMCECSLLEAAGPFQHIKSYQCRDMLMTYLKNLEAFGMAAKELEKLAQQECAPDVANYAAELVGAAFKDSWKLKSYLRG